MAHYGGLQCAVQAFDEAIGCGVMGSRPAEMDATPSSSSVLVVPKSFAPHFWKLMPCPQQFPLHANSS